MFSFYWPWLALLLPLPWLVRFFWPDREALEQEEEMAESVLYHPAIERLEQAFHSSDKGLQSHDWLQAILWALLWIALVATVMRPQWLEEHTQVTSRGYDLMLAVDTSRSMLALDFSLHGRKVTRMDVVKEVVDEFIQQRQGDRIGLILFGDQAYVQAPLTLDGAVVRDMLTHLSPGMVGDATAIGDAIGLAVKKLKERPAESRVLILITDGENTEGSLLPVQAAMMADHFNIRIYTIGVGSQQKEVPIWKEGKIEMEEMSIDENLLMRIAQQTGGQYFRATDTQALEAIYQDINTLEKTDAKSKTILIPQPLYRWPLGFALLILMMMVGISLGRNQQ